MSGTADCAHDAVMTQNTNQTAQAPFSAPSPAPRRLVRVREGRMIAGVCAGIARYLGVDATAVRLVMVALAFAGGTGLFVYLAGWLLMPEE